MKNIVIMGMLVFSLSSMQCAIAESVTNTQSSVTTTSQGEGNNSANTNSTTTTTSSTSTTTTNDGDASIVNAIYKEYVRVPALLGTALTVTCKNGVVTIEGTVTMQVQADEAIRVAKSIEGVKNVVSSINVTTNPAVDKSANTTNY